MHKHFFFKQGHLGQYNFKINKSITDQDKVTRNPKYFLNKRIEIGSILIGQNILGSTSNDNAS